MSDPEYDKRYEMARKRAIQWGMIFARAQSHIEEGLNLYGRLNGIQRGAIAHKVKGKHVYDLGAGSGELSLELIKLGAAKVTAIDSKPIPVNHPLIETKQCYFSDIPHDVRPEVTFLSWPQNQRDPNLLHTCRQSEVLIYLGKCTDGMACGQPELFEGMLERALLAYCPDCQNTLIILGETVSWKRHPRGEEYAGLHLNDSPVLSYDQVEAEAQEKAKAEAHLWQPADHTKRYVARAGSGVEARRQKR